MADKVLCRISEASLNAIIGFSFIGKPEELYSKVHIMKKIITKTVLVSLMAWGFMGASVTEAAPVSGAAKAAKAIFGGGKITGQKVRISTPPSRTGRSSAGYGSSGGYSTSNSFPAGPAIYHGSRAYNEHKRREEERNRSYSRW